MNKEKKQKLVKLKNQLENAEDDREVSSYSLTHSTVVPQATDENQESKQNPSMGVRKIQESIASA